MKVLFSTIKTFVPGLIVDAAEVGARLTFNGFLLDGLAAVKYEGQNDNVLSFEVRQNRPDCLSAVGIAKEVAAAFGKKFAAPKIPVIETKPANEVFAVKTKSGVKSVLAKKYIGLKNGPSPKWLKDFVEHSGMRSVSLLVDASNYVMLQTGYPSHVFDGRKLVGPLVWDNAKSGEQFVTLDGSVLTLNSGDLVVRDSARVVALAGVVGGQATGVTNGTQTAVVEMAMYDPASIRKSASTYGIRTEASARLGKPMSAAGMQNAFAWLCQIIEVESKTRSWSAAEKYGKFTDSLKAVVYDSSLASLLAGVEIPDAKARVYLERLGFDVKAKGKTWQVTAPAERSDILQDIDVAEEVVRMHDYREIPVHSPAFPAVANVTPKEIKLIWRCQQILPSLGLDEVYSLPFTTTEENGTYLWQDVVEAVAQNSINEETPVLRSTLIPGLTKSATNMAKKGLPHIQLFEFGRVFWKKGRKFDEEDRLALLVTGVDALAQAARAVRQLLGQLGLENVVFSKSETDKLAAGFNPNAFWNVYVGSRMLGVIAQLKSLHVSGTQSLKGVAVAEIACPILLEAIELSRVHATRELLEKVVVLDANISSELKQTASEVLAECEGRVPGKNLWSAEIVDTFHAGEKIKYTVRIAYTGLDDGAAKRMHSKLFSA